MHCSGESAEQICRQGDSDPVSALFPIGVQLFLSALAGPLPDPAHLQVGQGWLWDWHCASSEFRLHAYGHCQYLLISSPGALFVELSAL